MKFSGNSKKEDGHIFKKLNMPTHPQLFQLLYPIHAMHDSAMLHAVSLVTHQHRSTKR